YRADLGPKNVICGAARMIVWKADWDKYDPKVDERLRRYGYEGYGYGENPTTQPQSPAGPGQ
ncbi:MAG: hypothetical protein NTW86_31365, partial [Candidatus Sumerlaeota bacterium]|nr:hypothetical protein [Candidatus Sumerlaeota bacterium]